MVAKLSSGVEFFLPCTIPMDVPWQVLTALELLSWRGISVSACAGWGWAQQNEGGDALLGEGHSRMMGECPAFRDLT